MNFKTKIIKIEGKNLEGFFQNLITNDIKLLENNQALYSAMLTPQGKFLADFIIIKNKSFLFLETNSQNVNDVINLFSKYDLRKSLRISEATDIKTSCFLYNDLPLDIQVQLKKFNIIKKDNFFIFSDPRKNDYLVRVWTNIKNIKNIPKYISKETPQKLLELERIKKSIPDSFIDLEKEKSFILNFNFDKLNAISFNKGCYIGQENTSRQNYRGKIKYLLKTVKLIEGTFPKINTDLFCKKTKIGVMKSHLENYGLVLLKSDDSIKDKLLILDDYICKLKII
jgi:hypothetical protein